MKTTTSYLNILTPGLLALLCMAGSVNLAIAQETAANPNSLIDAITQGKPDLSVRYRFEHVDDDTALKEAKASTIRTTLGYTTGAFYGVGVRLLAQDVRPVVVDDYNDATGRPNAKTQYAVVADPSDTDLLEAYISYAGLPETTFKLGRQIITYRDAPFHRFMGTVLWRQNWQNHDAFTLENRSLPDTTIKYAYSWNVNRIFTDEAVASAKANFDSDSHFINIQYGGLPFGKFEAYSYLLDFKNAAAASTSTYGLRFNGGYRLTERHKLIYTAEYAKQDDYGHNPASVDEDYLLGEIGVNIDVVDIIDNITLKFSYELLSGNGVTSFQTPLATGHAFQGWADRFLATPADGIEDLIYTAVIKALGMNFIAAYHDLSADNGGYDYGTEIDVLASRGINKYLSVGAKYSSYDADRNLTNIARNGAIAADVKKFWVWVQFKF